VCDNTISLSFAFFLLCFLFLVNHYRWIFYSTPCSRNRFLRPKTFDSTPLSLVCVGDLINREKAATSQLPASGQLFTELISSHRQLTFQLRLFSQYPRKQSTLVSWGTQFLNRDIIPGFWRHFGPIEDYSGYTNLHPAPTPAEPSRFRVENPSPNFEK
jgi:hypothetical protein